MHELERRQEREANTIASKHEKQLQKLERDGERAVEGLEKEVKAAREEMERKKRDELADLTTQHWEELDEVNTRYASEIAKLKAEIDELRKSDEGRAAESADQVQALKDNITSLQTQLEAGNATMNSLRKQLASVEQQSSALEQEKAALVSKAHFLEGNQEAQSLEFTTMSEKLAEALAAKEATIETLRREEMLRRKLNATILELKGNIRVFVRTRPLLGDETDPAKVEYPDLDSLEGTKEMIVHAPTTKTATGKERNEKHAYGFDRVFTAGTPNRSVFEECQELVQSVIDGYNVSILSYGQTGSGKTFGMSGVDGIIPSSISHLLSEIRRLKSKGWDYVVEASFVEVYNEMINDLLGDAKTWDTDDDASARKKKEKHEIHHDPITGKTTVNNLTARALWPPPQDDASWPPAASDVPVDKPTDEQAMAYTTKAVDQLLDAAAKNRRVAATKANERSSRSHSIFMLTLKGSCPATGESSEGILNLVDLAGSERLKQSGAEGNRMKETQAINKSLSSLGDVIAALGSGKGEAHVPYRNSKVCLCLHSLGVTNFLLIFLSTAHLPPAILPRRYSRQRQVQSHPYDAALVSPGRSLAGESQQLAVWQQSAWNSHWCCKEALMPACRCLSVNGEWR
jgi:kinesin family protein C1